MKTSSLLWSMRSCSDPLRKALRLKGSAAPLFWAPSSQLLTQLSTPAPPPSYPLLRWTLRICFLPRSYMSHLQLAVLWDGVCLDLPCADTPWRYCCAVSPGQIMYGEAHRTNWINFNSAWIIVSQVFKNGDGKWNPQYRTNKYLFSGRKNKSIMAPLVSA